VVRSNEVVRRLLARIKRHSRNGPWTDECCSNWCTLVSLEVWFWLMMTPHCQPSLKFEIGVVRSTGVIRAVRSTGAIRAVRSTGVTLKRDVIPATNLK